LGLRWGRPRLAMPAKVDPEKAQKQWKIAKAAVEAPPEAAILYADESRIQLLPLIRAMWHWAGQQVRVPTPGSNKTRALFGALNIRTGQWTYLVRERIRKEDFVAFLEHLLIVYPSHPIILIVDNYSSHTAHLVRDWLEAHPRLQLYYLPTYCSHLNPVEDIWLRLKNHVSANRLYGSMKILLETVEAFFHDMTPEKALTWTAA
jgi:transposase